MPISRRTLPTIVLAALSVFLLAAALFFRARLESARERTVAVETRLEALEKMLESRPGKGHPDSLPAPLPGLTDREAKRLRARGLKDPARDLIIDLVRHPDLIPHEGVLGGKMGFYFPDRIWLLTDRWVLAYFEDGHMAGYLLLRYEVADDGAISWEVIRSYLA